ncbi:ABC transporter permease [Bifidobacterium sp. DSM 109957]|uniref:ABC transporter permease n=1 Tax=Bifidobacterium oedipodis TaxID=2675322 RepID=A0A7Y0HTG1_9BIFI|nr:ABC transporter permease [Bifidobacterium sp. DSM 109957]
MSPAPMIHLSRLSRRAAAILSAMAAIVMLVVAVLSLPSAALAVDSEAGKLQSNNGVALAEDGDSGSDATNVPTAGPVPNIIITNFTYDGDSVAAGSSFNLAFTFQNMGQVAVSNMVVTVDGGESFAIAGGSNTFYVDALWAGYFMTQTVPMQAVASAQSGAQPVTVSFRYEYVDAGVRSSNQSDIKISVPISQPDRFEVSDPVLPDESTGGAYAGQETTITLEYVNKGKGDVSNVEATMEGEGFDATQKTQYVGNVASGATGSIGYAFTPQAAGDLNATLKITYEDSDGQSKTKEFPIALSVMDMPVTPDNGGMVDPNLDPNANNQTVPWWTWLLAVVALAVIVLIVVLVVRRRKKKAKASDIDEEWDDWSAGDANTGAPSAAGGAGAGATDGVTGTVGTGAAQASTSGAHATAADTESIPPVAAPTAARHA